VDPDSGEWDSMNIALSPDLETALNKLAQRQGVSPEALVLEALRERFLGPRVLPVPQDEWERRLLAGVKNYGVSLPNSVLSRDELYD
jgi:hypothetical protein